MLLALIRHTSVSSVSAAKTGDQQKSTTSESGTATNSTTNSVAKGMPHYWVLFVWHLFNTSQFRSPMLCSRRASVGAHLLQIGLLVPTALLIQTILSGTC